MQKIKIILVVLGALAAVGVAVILFLNVSKPIFSPSNPTHATSTPPQSLATGSNLKNGPFGSCTLKDGYCEVKDKNGAVAETLKFLASGSGNFFGNVDDDILVVTQTTFLTSSSSPVLNFYIISHDQKLGTTMVAHAGGYTLPRPGEFHTLTLLPAQKEFDITIAYPQDDKRYPPFDVRKFSVVSPTQIKLIPNL